MVAVIKKFITLFAFISVMAFMGFFAVTVSADNQTRELLTGEDNKGWEAVGRLNIHRHGFCTGALIAPDMVLTAAHCVFDDRSGQPIPLGKFEFVAGWRNGRADAYRGVRRIAVHPDYDYGSAEQFDRVSRDVALVQLDRPIRNSSIQPFETSGKPGIGAAVGIVSYAQDRENAPTLEELCRVLARRSSVLILSCDINFGSSGAPIFVMEDGKPRIVSVVSAKAEVFNQNVALAASLDSILDEVRSVMYNSGGSAGEPRVNALPTIGSGNRSGSGAKFVQP